MSTSRGRVYAFAHMNCPDTWEAQLLEQVLPLSRLQDALQTLTGNDNFLNVEIKRSLGLPRYEGVADIIHSHPAFFDRQVACLRLDDVAYRTIGETVLGGESFEAEDVGYAQVSIYVMSGVQSFKACNV